MSNEVLKLAIGYVPGRGGDGPGYFFHVFTCPVCSPEEPPTECGVCKGLGFVGIRALEEVEVAAVARGCAPKFMPMPSADAVSTMPRAPREDDQDILRELTTGDHQC